MSHAFWDWSLERYDEPGVAAEALRLQDKHGLNVNICLWCIWLAEEGRDVSSLIGKAIQAIAPWSKGITETIRDARLQAKEHPRAETLYKSILACELDAEQVEQDILFELAADVPATDEAAESIARRALAAYARTTGTKVDFENFLKTVLPTVKKV